jgi:cytochrome c-type biogenesis protein CcmF
MWQTLPEFGTGVLYAILVAAAYTFAVSIVAGRSGKTRHLEASRAGAYGTVALIMVAVLVLAYAFVTHDFRIRYVARYSDRSMTVAYLFTSLWGGQDGSLLWWTFLMSLYTGACLVWMKGRYRELQPYVIATLMTIVSFFAVLMLFAANPFWTSLGGARADGEGLNPLLQNFYMIIHPPSLYTGFVGCSIPFAFAVAALVTGRLDNEWINAVRKWMLFAWMFLTIGNGLGMLWAYEELGWGGYWAWDPVENAACLPWFTASAYIHSTMTQERRGMLKIWNVVLIFVTFFLTIFGTFLTRSGMISSVHSFAQSDIGKYFVWYLGMLVAASAGLIVWRLPLLRSEGKIDAWASREAAFVVNNWALLGMMTFILVATLFPKLSELWGESITVGPPFFNRWLAPIGLAVFALMGAGPLFGWRKTSNASLKRAFMGPTVAMIVMGIVHVAFGKSIGFPAFVEAEPIYVDKLGLALEMMGRVLPLITTMLCAFNIAVVVEEFARGISARRATNANENIFTALFTLVARSRRRYGGYIVHLGVVLLFIGFVGKAWGIDKETSLHVGETYKVSRYNVTYVGSRMEVDTSKRMIFADVKVTYADSGEVAGQVSPAKFIYRKSPDMPTTEVAMLHSVKDDLYVVVGSVNPDTKVATFQLHVNPLVSWIWLGIIVMICGSMVSLWPEVSREESRAWSFGRAIGATASIVMMSVLFAIAPTRALAQSSSLHAGTVEMHTPLEREVFSMLLCQCGACARLPLSNCVCSTADEERAGVRSQIQAGVDKAQIYANYVAKYGSKSLSVPPNQGGLRAIFLGPLLVIVAGGISAVFVLRRWKRKGEPLVAAVPGAATMNVDEEYDRKLDEELRRLD